LKSQRFLSRLATARVFLTAQLLVSLVALLIALLLCRSNLSKAMP
jgi:hypothetical protein